MMRWCLTGRTADYATLIRPTGWTIRRPVCSSRSKPETNSRTAGGHQRRRSTGRLPHMWNNRSRHPVGELDWRSPAANSDQSTRQSTNLSSSVPGVQQYARGACARPDQQFRDTYPEMRWLSGCGTMRMVASLRWGRRTYPAWKIRSI